MFNYCTVYCSLDQQVLQELSGGMEEQRTLLNSHQMTCYKDTLDHEQLLLVSL